jgi:uncharacterized protein YuzE
MENLIWYVILLLVFMRFRNDVVFRYREPGCLKVYFKKTSDGVIVESDIDSNDDSIIFDFDKNKKIVSVEFENPGVTLGVNFYKDYEYIDDLNNGFIMLNNSRPIVLDSEYDPVCNVYHLYFTLHDNITLLEKKYEYFTALLDEKSHIVGMKFEDANHKIVQIHS